MTTQRQKSVTEVYSGSFDVVTAVLCLSSPSYSDGITI
ncbi:hypothetical protein A2U01_0080942, partial [Trifolium medium]|nr:hypothetical protein [Trifolium medium]